MTITGRICIRIVDDVDWLFKKLFPILLLIFLFAITAQAQDCPNGMVCISQAAANKAAENARELEATKEKVIALEQALTAKDKSISELRETARRNETDLKEALTRTQTELAAKTGQLIATEANLVRLTAITEFLLKHGRKKCYGLCVQF